HVEAHPVAQHTRVVHQDVETAEGIVGQLDEAAGAVPTGHILAVGDGPPAGGGDLPDDRRPRFLVGPLTRPARAPAGAGHARPPRGQRTGLRAPQTTSRSGDDGDQSVEHPHATILRTRAPASAGSLGGGTPGVKPYSPRIATRPKGKGPRSCALGISLLS